MKKNSILDRLFHRNDGKKVAQAELRDMGQHEDEWETEMQLEQRLDESFKAIQLEWRNTKLDAGLTQALKELSASIQVDVDYAYLSLHPEFKKKLDSFIGKVLKLPAFQQLMGQCEKAVKDLCSFHGNNEAEQAHSLDDAHGIIQNSLGNEIMDSLLKEQKVTRTTSRDVYFRQQIIFPVRAMLSNEILIGMATQEGEEYYDPSSSRSLWGRLPGADTLEDIDDLWAARDAVDVPAKTYGIWYATIKVSSEIAQRHDLNRRENWKVLLGDKINVMADELGIPQKDFYWVASMHDEAAHGSHVHIMCWDGSYTVHPQVMPVEKFRAMQERIRSSFEEGITNLKVPQLTSQEQAPAPEPELEDGEELEP